MRFELQYEPDQIRRVIDKFEAMGIAASDAQPVMTEIAGMMMVALGKNFEAQGRRGGGSWKRLSAEWLGRKQRLGLDTRIGFATGALVHSLTTPGGAGNILEVGPTFARVGSDLPYAEVMQRHRPFAYMSAGDRLEMRLAVRKYLVDAWKAAR